MIEEEEEESRRESVVNFVEPQNPTLIINFDRQDSRSRSRKTSEHHTKKFPEALDQKLDLNISKIYSDLPENLVKIFEVIISLSIEEE